MKVSKEQLYKRQMTLPEIGSKGQEKLLLAQVAIIGCGGLGSAVAVYLAASGVGHLHLVDYDLIDQSNLHRQVFYGLKDLGKPKAQILRDHIHKISPFVQVTNSGLPITKGTISNELENFPIIIDCTDSLKTKYLLNDYCVIANKVLVYGSLYKHDGYVGTFNTKSEGVSSANLRDAFPSIPDKHIPNCSEIGTLNPIVGIIAMMQTNEAIKVITGLGNPLINQILIYNALENSQFIMKLKSGFNKDKIEKIFEHESYFDERCEIQENQLLINAKELKERLDKNELHIVSVIENPEVGLPFEVNQKIPLSSFEVSDLNPVKNRDLVIICHKGISSYKVTKMIKKELPDINVYSLKNGIDAY